MSNHEGFIEAVIQRVIELQEAKGCRFKTNVKQEAVRRYNRERAYLLQDEQLKNWIEQTLTEYETYCPAHTSREEIQVTRSCRSMQECGFWQVCYLAGKCRHRKLVCEGTVKWHKKHFSDL